MNVIFFGDSICVGEKVSPHRTWVTRLAGSLAKRFRDEVLVINSSVNGNTTRQALERMPFDVQRYRVDLLVVQFGLNDCNYWQTDEGVPRVSPEAFEANLLEIAARGRVFGARKVIFHTNHPTTRTSPMPHTSVAYEDGNVRYNAIIRRAAARAPATLVDLEQAFQGAVGGGRYSLEDLLLPDGLHLSDRGHDLYVEATEQVVTDAVDALLGCR